MKRIMSGIFIVLFLLATGCAEDGAIGGSSQRYSISGHVQDPFGQRLSGVEITYGGAESGIVHTDSFGEFVLLQMRATTSLSARKNGWEIMPSDHQVNAGTYMIYTATRVDDPSTRYQVNLKLGGFPYVNTHRTLSYIHVLAVDSEASVLEVISLGGHDKNSLVDASLYLLPETTSLVIYVGDSQEHFAVIWLTDGVYDYTNQYWIDHNAYLFGAIEFGPSYAMVEEVLEDSFLRESLNFSEVPYYLYKIKEDPNTSMSMEVETNSGEILVNARKYFNFHLDYSTVTSGASLHRSLDLGSDEVLYILITAENYRNPTTGLLQFDHDKQFPLWLESRYCVAVSEHPEFVFVSNGDQLHYVNPISGVVFQSFSLPYIIESMYYSDGVLYMTSVFASGHLEWNTSTHIWTHQQYSQWGGSILAVDVENRRLLRAISSNFVMVDLDSNVVVLDMPLGNGRFAAYDPTGKKLFVEEKYSLRQGVLSRYSVENDIVRLEEAIYLVPGSDLDMVLPHARLHPSEHQLLIVDGLNQLKVVDPNHMSTVLQIMELKDSDGTLVVPVATTYSGCGRYIYLRGVYRKGFQRYQYLYQLDAESLEIIGKRRFEPIDSRGYILSNQDGSSILTPVNQRLRFIDTSVFSQFVSNFGSLDCSDDLVGQTWYPRYTREQMQDFVLELEVFVMSEQKLSMLPPNVELETKAVLK